MCSSDLDSGGSSGYRGKVEFGTGEHTITGELWVDHDGAATSTGYIDLGSSNISVGGNVDFEDTVVISDFQRKPNVSNKKIEFVAEDIPQVHSIFQTESHGVLPIQVADMLLGGYLYSLNPESGDKEGNKTRIAQKVLELKRKVGNNKFNCWEVNWSKSSRIKRV